MPSSSSTHPAPTALSPLSLHDALPISRVPAAAGPGIAGATAPAAARSSVSARGRSEEHTSELQSRVDLVCRLLLQHTPPRPLSPLFPYTTLFRSPVSPPPPAPVSPAPPPPLPLGPVSPPVEDRKSTRLNSSHEWISYAVFFFNTPRPDRSLPSFPTRRSSDLPCPRRRRPRYRRRHRPRCRSVQCLRPW